MWKQGPTDGIRAVGRVAAAILLLLVPPETAAQRAGGPCAAGLVRCFLPPEGPSVSSREPAPYSAAAPSLLRVVTAEVCTLHRGPLAHHWIQFESSRGEVTIGFGPATIPFIDTGQISIFDAQGSSERIGGLHLPFVDFNYSKPPGAGYSIGKPIPLSIAQADALVGKQRQRKFIGPYVPIFHDCHTWVCTVEATPQGKSTLPCYLWFKGYW